MTQNLEMAMVAMKKADMGKPQRVRSGLQESNVESSAFLVGVY